MLHVVSNALASTAPSTFMEDLTPSSSMAQTSVMFLPSSTKPCRKLALPLAPSSHRWDLSRCPSNIRPRRRTSRSRYSSRTFRKRLFFASRALWLPSMLLCWANTEMEGGRPPESRGSGRSRGPRITSGTAGFPSSSCPRRCAWRRIGGCVRPSSSARSPARAAPGWRPGYRHA